MQLSRALNSRPLIRAALPALSLAAAACAFVLGDVGGTRTALFSPGTRFLAQVVGVSVSIPENEFNTLAQRLQERSNALDDRERQAAAREAELSAERSATRRMAWVMAGISALLLSLILLNFWADWRRGKDNVS